MSHWTRIRDENGPDWAAFQSSILKILDSAIDAVGANKGNVQLFNPTDSNLEIIASRGFEPQFLKKFENVGTNESSACSRAFRNGHRVVVPDVTSDPLFAPFLQIARESGFRAVQSTPIVDSLGSVIGVLSTHFLQVHYLPATSEYALDRYVSEIAQFYSELMESSKSQKSLNK